MKNRRSLWICRCGRSTWSLKMRRSTEFTSRSYLERHLPYAAIHAALMDIAMGHQTAADDAKAPFTPEVFDPCSLLPPACIVAG